MAALPAAVNVTVAGEAGAVQSKVHDDWSAPGVRCVTVTSAPNVVRVSTASVMVGVPAVWPSAVFAATSKPCRRPVAEPGAGVVVLTTVTVTGTVWPGWTAVGTEIETLPVPLLSAYESWQPEVAQVRRMPPSMFEPSKPPGEPDGYVAAGWGATSDGREGEPGGSGREGEGAERGIIDVR